MQSEKNVRKVSKHVLSNGMNVLYFKNSKIPKVSLQLWYNVGSKDEKSGEKGIAHLIEHMIFKGTKILSESDINVIVNKLSGYCNAFTSQDYTGYLFDFPSQNWHTAIDIFADCMENVHFNEQFLNSELSAVVQELKMYKDDDFSSLCEKIMSSVFFDHPYRDPIIGYKKDLWALERDSLLNFYKKHYLPNNATLVAVGDIGESEFIEYVEKSFKHIKPNWDYVKDIFYHGKDLVSNSVILYRDIKQPFFLCGWQIPGTSSKSDYLLDLLSRIVGHGRGSRLYKILVDNLELATDIEAFNYDCFEAGIFCIKVVPKNIKDIDKIIEIINIELADLAANGPKCDELFKASRKTELDYINSTEDNQKIAYNIGKYFLATGDENFVFNYLDQSNLDFKEEIKLFADKYFLPSLMIKGQILPLSQADKKYWLELQELSDVEDKRILEGRTRNIPVEAARHVENIQAKLPKMFKYPVAEKFILNNGLLVLSNNNSLLPKIDMILSFKSKYFYDPIDKQGLCAFVFDMLLEGTKNYSCEQLSDLLDSFGIELNSSSGQITMSLLAKDFSKGIEILNEILTQAIFSDDSIVKVKEQMIADINDFWDQPRQFSTLLAKQAVYKNHPYSQSSIGTLESITAITKNDLLHFYETYLSPKACKIAIVGDISNINLQEVLEEKLGDWAGSAVVDIKFPELAMLEAVEQNYKIARDQVVLTYAGLSVNRANSDFDKLLVFEQIFSGGILGSMSSRLFDLRERSGLFYTISGSLTSGSGKQPGMVVVKTIVSNDRLSASEIAIEDVINNAINTINSDELDSAKNALINCIVDNFATNYQTAITLLFKEEFGFADNYFDTRYEQIKAVTLEDIKSIVPKYLNSKKLVKIRAGRV